MAMQRSHKHLLSDPSSRNRLMPDVAQTTGLVRSGIFMEQSRQKPLFLIQIGNSGTGFRRDQCDEMLSSTDVKSFKHMSALAQNHSSCVWPAHCPQSGVQDETSATAGLVRSWLSHPCRCQFQRPSSSYAPRSGRHERCRGCAGLSVPAMRCSWLIYW